MANKNNCYQLDIPLYTISSILNGKYYCLAGGGGLSKTGIKNKMIIMAYNENSQCFNIKKQLEVSFGAITSSIWNEDLKIMIFAIETTIVLYKMIEILKENDVFIDLIEAIDLKKDDLLKENDSINIIRLFNQSNQCLIGTLNGNIIQFDIINKTYYLIIRTIDQQEIQDLSINPLDQMISCATISAQSSFVYRFDSLEPIVNLSLNFGTNHSNGQYIIRNCMFTKNNFLITTHHYVSKSNKWTNKQAIKKTISNDNYLVIWSEETLIPLLKYSFVHTKSIFIHKCISNHFILGCIDGSLNIFDQTTFKLVNSIKQQHKLAMTCICNYSMSHTTTDSFNSKNILSLITAAADSSVFISHNKVPKNNNDNIMIASWFGIFSIISILLLAVFSQIFIFF